MEVVKKKILDVRLSTKVGLFTSRMSMIAQSSTNAIGVSQSYLSARLVCILASQLNDVSFPKTQTVDLEKFQRQRQDRPQQQHHWEVQFHHLLVQGVQPMTTRLIIPFFYHTNMNAPYFLCVFSVNWFYTSVQFREHIGVFIWIAVNWKSLQTVGWDKRRLWLWPPPQLENLGILAAL